MKKYLGIKVVSAEPMSRNEAGKAGLVRNFSENDENSPGYKVVYEDGYESWSPKSTFEKAYRATDGLTFGEAIEALKAGKKAARKGWNGKGMFIFLTEGDKVDRDVIQNGHVTSSFLEKENCEQLELLPHIDMWTVNSRGRKAYLFGWQASQTDMLSDDWIIVD